MKATTRKINKLDIHIKVDLKVEGMDGTGYRSQNGKLWYHGIES